MIARSTNAIVTPGDVLPYYVEMNRVKAVAGNRLELEDVTISNCSLTGATDDSPHNLIWFYKGRQRDILFDGVRGPGLVTIDDELPGDDERGRG